MGLFNFWQKRESVTGAKPSTGTQKGVQVRGSRVWATNTSALQVAAFYHAINLRANTFARADIRIERNIGGVWMPAVRDIAHAQDIRHLQYLIQVKPNEYMTADQMWRRLSYWRDMEGSCAILLGRTANGMVHRLYPVHNLSWNGLNNTYHVVSDELMKSLVVPANDLIIMCGMQTLRRPMGESLKDVAEKSLSISLTADNFALDTLAKGGTMKLFVSEEVNSDPLQGLASLDDSEVHKAVDDLREQAAENMDLIFSQGNLDVKVRSQSYQDLQVLMTKDAIVSEVGRICSVPLPLMFTATNAVYKSVDDAWHTFIELFLNPLMDTVVQEFNAKVFGEDYHDVLRFTYSTDMLCLDSDNTKAQAANARRNAGITTSNEERMLMGLAPHPEGDTLIMKQIPQEPKLQEDSE